MRREVDAQPESIEEAKDKAELDCRLSLLYPTDPFARDLRPRGELSLTQAELLTSTSDGRCKISC